MPAQRLAERPAPTFERALPASLEAEQATLGSVLMNRDALIPIASWLTPDMFYVQQHAWVYEAMLHCFQRRIPPDVRTVAERLREQERLDQVGGITALATLVQYVPSSYHVEHYARVVQKKALLRRLIETGGAISQLGYEQQDAEIGATIAEAHGLLMEATQISGDRPSMPIGAIVDAQFEPLCEGIPAGRPTGFLDYDEQLGGLYDSDLVLLAARPRTGKTSFALSLAAQLATRVPVYFISLEMSKEQLGQRMLALETGIDLHRLRQRRLSDSERIRVAQAMGTIAALSLDVLDRPVLTMSALRAEVLRYRSTVDALGVVIVDYAQLIEPDRKTDNRVVDVSTISRGLKQLAREVDVPVLALCQLNRAVESRPDHLPVLSDLRESGSWEQDADIVMFIHREELYDKDSDKKGIAELHVAKNRNGPVCVVPLRFDAATTRFQNLTYHSHGGRGYA